MFFQNIKKLVQYGIETGLTPECERIYTTNLLLDLFQEDSYEDVDIAGQEIELEVVLKELLDEAVLGALSKTVLCIVICLIPS